MSAFANSRISTLETKLIYLCFNINRKGTFALQPPKNSNKILRKESSMIQTSKQQRILKMCAGPCITDQHTHRQIFGRRETGTIRQSVDKSGKGRKVLHSNQGVAQRRCTNYVSHWNVLCSWQSQKLLQNGCSMYLHVPKNTSVCEFTLSKYQNTCHNHSKAKCSNEFKVRKEMCAGL